MNVKTFTFGIDTNITFESGVLAGFDFDCNWPSFEDALPLIKALGFAPDADDDFWGLSEEEVFGLHPDGRIALIGLTQAGRAFVVH